MVGDKATVVEGLEGQAELLSYATTVKDDVLHKLMLAT